MIHELRIVPPHSLVLLVSQPRGQIPIGMAGKSIAHTPSCIAVGCRAADDGATLLRIGPMDEMSASNHSSPKFRTHLDVIGGALSLEFVDGTRLLALPLQEASASIAIWVNHPTEPDLVEIGIK